MKKIYAILAIALTMPFAMQAQSDEDALRYSMMNFGGTARSWGSANAFGALGGDFSSLSMNPAGLGIYRSSEFVFTPALVNFNNQSSFYNNSLETNRYNFNVSNLGLVFSKVNTGKENASSGWVGGGFASGYNRLENYNNRIAYTGFNDRNSITEFYAAQLSANGGTNPSNAGGTDPFGAGLAWETYLLNPNPGDSTSYYSVVNGGNIQQSKTQVTNGAMDEMVISFAGNYGNRLYMGLTIGVPFISYTSTTTFSESDVNNVHPDFNSMSQVEFLETNGAGVNAKFGIIYRLNNYIRLGGAIHTPTALGMSDFFYTNMQSSLDTTGSYAWESPQGRYDYNLVTPWRAIASMALTFGKYGFLSVDYEFVDYTAANFNFNRIGSTDDIAFETALNSTIDAKYSSANNLRIGAELVYEIFRLRGGYAIMGSPFADGVATGDADFSRNTYTLGAGIRERSYFIDFAYANTRSTTYDVQYNYATADGANEGATIDRVTNNFLVTLGFRF
jgi:hypothetical protein